MAFGGFPFRSGPVKTRSLSSVSDLAHFFGLDTFRGDIKVCLPLFFLPLLGSFLEVGPLQEDSPWFNFGSFLTVRSPSTALLPFFKGGLPYSNRLPKNGYPYSNLPTGGPRLLLGCICRLQLFGWNLLGGFNTQPPKTPPLGWIFRL